MDEAQQRRIAANEARFRAANERVTEATRAFDEGAAEYALMCECALTECQDMLEISRPDYEQVRSNPRWFAVLPAHVMPPAIERVLEAHSHYWIVEKIAAVAEVAEELA